MNIRESIVKNNNNATNVIAYVILGIFCLFLLIILVKALNLYSSTTIANDKHVKHAETWLTLFKDGFLLLGGALTTLIGYYFGNKGSEAALNNAEKYNKETQDMLSQLDDAAPTFSEDDSTIKPLDF